MKLGVSIFATDYAMRPDEFARACEERGFESVWYPTTRRFVTIREKCYEAIPLYSLRSWQPSRLDGQGTEVRAGRADLGSRRCCPNYRKGGGPADCSRWHRAP